MLPHLAKPRAFALAAAALALGAAAFAGTAVLRDGAAPQASKARIAGAAPDALRASWSTIGRVDPGATAFGLIGDAVASASGQVLVLDVMERRVGFAPAAGPVTWTGRPGRGPGEFFVPTSLAAKENGAVYVLDRGNQRIETYTLDAQRLTRTGAIPLPFSPEDVCALGDRLFVLGGYRGHTIHEVSPITGQMMSSFAPDPHINDELLATFRAGGYLACGPGPEITFLSMLRAEVQRFSPVTGALLGAATIPGYRAVEVRRIGGGVAFTAPDGGHDRAASVTALPDGRMIVQVGRLRPGAATSQEFSTLRSYLLTWPEGTIQALSGDLPRITSAAGDWVLAVDTEPVPALRKLALTLPPRPRR